MSIVQPEGTYLDAVVDRLPADVHARLLSGRDPIGCDIAYVLLWADRPYSRCPRCGQSVAVDLSDAPPAVLDEGAGAGGTVQAISQQHGCGEWLAADWTRIDVAGVSETRFHEDVLAVAVKLAAVRAKAIQEERKAIEARLKATLSEAFTLLADPLDDGETVEDRLSSLPRGSQTAPGVYLEGNTVIVWDLDPIDPSETITVSFDIAVNRLIDFIDWHIHKALRTGGHYVLNKAIDDHDNEWGKALQAAVSALIEAGAINQGVHLQTTREMR